MKTLNKILVVGPAWVGDMVMAQSLFKVINHIKPDSTLDVLAPSWSGPLLERMPEVNAAHELGIGHGVLNIKLRYQLAQTIKNHHYDEAIVLPNSWKSALIPFLANIPKRTGFRGEMRYGLLNDVRILDKEALPKMIERFVALAYEKNARLPQFQDIPIPRLATKAPSIQAALLKFSLMDNTQAPIIALCPGAEFGASKRWPEEYFATLANQKLNEGYSVWLFGSKNDLPTSTKIQQLTQNRCVDLTGRTSLGEAIDLLSITSAVISNDSGLMHIAAALDRPLVAVYGSTDPGFTPPLNERSKIARLGLQCSPCFKRVCPLKHHHCMKEMTPAFVGNILKNLLTSVLYNQNDTQGNAQSNTLSGVPSNSGTTNSTSNVVRVQ